MTQVAEGTAVSTTPVKHVKIMEALQATKPEQIFEMDFVKDKFIQNYNLCHKGNNGELQYNRQLMFIKQAIAGSEQLQKCDKLSIYACFVTAAVKGYSLDPADDEIYIIPRGGKAYLQRQAGAHIRRLLVTKQIKSADQPKLVYKGDDFAVTNGKVNHVEKFQTEEFIAAYIRYVLPDDTEKYFVYRKSDWEAWKEKSPQKGGPLWTGNNGQPNAAFLRTKIILHSAKSKAWATGSIPAEAESFNVEIDVDDTDKPAIEAKSEVIDSFSTKEEVKETATVVVETSQDEKDSGF